MKRIALLSLLVAGMAHWALGAATPPPPAPANDAGVTLWQPYRITPRIGAQHVALDGEWQLGWSDAAVASTAGFDALNNWFTAQVPSSVQWALHRAGKGRNPYEHLNSKDYDWVDQKVWYYRRKFEMPAKTGDGYAFLCFDGIDYFARVWLNGELLGRHEGMFGGPEVEVSKQVKFGAANEVVVEVKAGNFGNKTAWKPRGPEGTVIKPWVIAGGTGGEMFFPLGMWRGAHLEIVPLGHLERPFLVTESVEGKTAKLRLEVEVMAGVQSLQFQLHPWKNSQLVDGSHGWAGSPPSKSKFALRVELVEKAGGKSALDQTFPLKTFAGRNFIQQSLAVPEPKLWWPNGMGEPNLYCCKLTLIREGKAEDALEFESGIRKIETVPSAGPRTADRWANWQFVVNGRPFFVKGINWMPADLLLDLPRERYRWLLGAAKNAGIQLLRIWGGGILETEEFYETCNELGLTVWQDFPIGNRDTPEWPQDVWEAQVLQTIFRLRNHPSLALYCGGNEFNPYSIGNAATIGIFERCVADFDPTRPMRRTSPDGGSIHTYPDMDPTWYGHLYRQVPYLSESGMHSIPDAQSIREVVNPDEVSGSLGSMMEKSFPAQHPELMQHFVEFQRDRVPRMLSRASHIADVSAPTLDTLSEATQIGAGEFYQIFSEQMQADYPVTTGLMPWVFKRPWPVIAIMLVDGFGQPTAPYYFLKRTYEPTHLLVRLAQLMWAKGETVPIQCQVTHAGGEARADLQATVEVFDPAFVSVWKKSQPVSLKPGPSVAEQDFGGFAIPDSFDNRFFFVVAELRQTNGKVLSRSVYWPRCLSQMSDAGFREKYRASPQPGLMLDKGPWLKPQAGSQPTKLSLSASRQGKRLVVRIRNTGGKPAFLTRLDVEGAKRLFYATDNFFWLAPGEERELDVEISWREPSARTGAMLAVSAWNAQPERCPLPGDAP